jgi:alpha-L-fucosidase
MGDIRGPADYKSAIQQITNLRYTARDIRCTTSGRNLYALALGWPDDRRLIVRSLAAPAGKVRKVSLLGQRGKLAREQTEACLIVTMPEEKPCDHVFALRIIGTDLKPAPVPVTANVVRPQADGRILCRATDATIHGNSPQYEPGGGKDQIGHWGNPQDFVSWAIKLTKPGTFAVSATYSCNPGAEGSEFFVEVSTQKLVSSSKPTGSWAEYITEPLGQATLDQPGTITLSVKFKTDKVPWKVIGLKSITLTRADDGVKGAQIN